MIGSVIDAQRAIDGDLEYLDSGSARMVFRAGSVVYKTEIERGSNGIEWDNYLDATERNFPDSIRIPKTAMFYMDGMPVIAMEYISGQPIARCYCLPTEAHMPDCMTDSEFEFLSRYHTDLSGHNVVRTDEGLYYIIDFDC